MRQLFRLPRTLGRRNDHGSLVAIAPSRAAIPSPTPTPGRAAARFLPGALALLALAAACDPPAPPAPTIAIDSAGVRIVTSDPIGSTASCTLSPEPIFSIGDSEDDDNQWFSSVRGVGRLSDGSVAVADRASAEVRIFAPDGSHLLSMGRHGEGPGEFQDPFVLWALPGDTLWVGDYRPWRYVVFTREGEWVRNVALDPMYPNPSRGGGVLDNGVSVNALDKSARARDFAARDTLVVEAHDRDGRRIGVLARLPARTMGRATDTDAYNYYISPYFDSRAEVDARERAIALAHTSTAEVRLFDEEFRLRSIVRWEVPNQEVTAADLRTWREEYVIRRNTGSNVWDDDFDGPMISSQRPVADVMPVLSSVLVGRDGRLWVRPYRRPGGDATRWMAFAREGEFLCHLERLPPGSNFDVWEFGADYALGLRTSDLGVETVLVHALHGPGEGDGEANAAEGESR